MLDAVIDVLACPHCRHRLAREGGALRCDAGHSFDVARQGYVNLLRGPARAGTADTTAMVAARDAFLGSGHFEPIAEAVASAVVRAAADIEGCVIDVGAGTGYYLAAALRRLPERVGLALDISKHAAQRAARAHPRIGAAVCDAWSDLPVLDGAAAAIMSVFAPRNAAEFVRILGSGGGLVVASPTPAHLAELVSALGLITVDARKEERLAEAFGGCFERETAELVETRLHLTAVEACALVQMGPSARHVDPDEVERRIDALGGPVGTTASVAVTVWRRR